MISRLGQLEIKGKAVQDLKSNMPRLLRILFVLIVAVAMPTDAFCDKPKIGIIIPLTGKAAMAGETVRNSTIMANDDLGNPFELIFEDNALDNVRTVTIARSLLKTKGVRSLIVYGSGPSNAAAPLAEQAQIPMIGLSIDPNVSKSKTWVMIHWASSKHVVDQLIFELKKRGLTRVAVVTSQVQGILDLEDYFLEKAKESDFKVIFSKQVLPSETDFSTMIAKLRTSDAQAIFLNLYFGQVGTFARQSVTQGYRPQFFGQFALDNGTEISASQGTLNGAFFANTAAGDLSFDKAYTKRFGWHPTLGGISAYDVIYIFDSAFKESPHSSESINYFIHSLRDFSGKIGVYGALDSNSFDVPASIGDIVDGRVVKRPARQVSPEKPDF